MLSYVCVAHCPLLDCDNSPHCMSETKINYCPKGYEANFQIHQKDGNKVIVEPQEIDNT